MNNALYQKQLELENEACDAAREKLEAIINEALANGQADRTTVGKKIAGYTFKCVKKAIAEKIEKDITPRGGVQGVHVPFLKSILAAWVDAERDVEELYDIITLATVTTAIAAALDVTHKHNTISAAGIEVARQIVDEVHLYAIGHHDGKLKAHEKSIDKRVSVKNKQIYIRHLLSRHAEIKLDAVNSIKTALGVQLLANAINAGLGDFVQIERYDKYQRIVPTQILIETYNKNAEKLLTLAHKFVPTIIPPAPWSDPTNGAYHGRLKAYSNLIRLQDCTTQYIEQYQARLRMLDLDEVYSALNAYQETAYKINERVVDVLDAVIAKGGEIAGIPRMIPYDEIPPIPEDADPQTVWAYKEKRVDWIHREIARKTKALRMLTTAAAAKKFKEYEEIYFPINMDWRGRMYPMPAMLTPQGDDTQKAVLEFAKPQVIETTEQGEEALKWIKIQLANTAGKDKLTYDERIAWTEENAEAILRVANDPLGDELGLWEDADEPWCFLAACFAYADAIAYKKAHGDLIGFSCGLPVAMDATCSVLQHFASIMHNDNLARLVNLKNEATVQDVYGEVAKKVTEIVKHDAEQGTKDTEATRQDGESYIKRGTKSLAKKWLEYALETSGEAVISRKITKKCVMTYGYGSELYGFKERIYNEFIKPLIDERGGRENTMFADCVKPAASYMAKIIWKVVCEELVAVEETKNYIKSVVGVALAENIETISWTTPDGLLIQSSYNTASQKKIQLRVANKTLAVYSMDTTEEVDARKQEQAISPNFIHSRDAAHMRAVLRACVKAGMKNYMMIHDSFGVEAANAEKLYKILRETFIDMYANGDALKEFVDDLHYLAPMAQFEELPKKGTYDVHEVGNAKYAFC